VLKIIGYWTAPREEDLEAFEHDYMTNHVPKALRLPGLRRLVTTRVTDGWQGGTPEHYRIVEAEFESREALEATFSTPEFAAMRADRQRLIETYGVENHAEVGEAVVADLA
jgi:uncharacterized protein (TIGR02118 family)